MNFFDIKKKIVIVVGAGRGLGLEISKYLISQKVEVIGVDKIFQNTNKSILFSKKIITNLKNTKNLKKKFSSLINKNKKINGLVFCAGITNSNENYNSFNESKLKEHFNVNVQSAYVINYLVANSMIKQKIKGSIINFTSIGAHQAFPKNPYYCSSKGALKQLTKSFAYDYGPKGIRFNNIVPGYFKTPMNKKTLSSLKKKSQRSQRNILLRWGEPSEICGAVHFLLSDASSYITASDLVVDGGWLNKGL